MAQAHCTLDTEGYKHTPTMCSTSPLQQWLHDRASIIRYTYIDCLVTSLSGVCPDCRVLSVVARYVSTSDGSCTGTGVACIV